MSKRVNDFNAWPFGGANSKFNDLIVIVCLVSMREALIAKKKLRDLASSTMLNEEWTSNVRCVPNIVTRFMYELSSSLDPQEIVTLSSTTSRLVTSVHTPPCAAVFLQSDLWVYLSMDV